MYQDLSAEMASPPTLGPTGTQGVCSCSFSPSTPKDPQPGSTQMGSNHHLALLCFADNFFLAPTKYFLCEVSLLYQ